HPTHRIYTLSLPDALPISMPNMNVWRPCDAAETAVAWTLAVERRAPTALVLTRQALPQQPRSPAQLGNISRGGYVLIDPGGTPEDRESTRLNSSHQITSYA